MSRVPRQPSYYYPGYHAYQQHKHRDIDWKDVARTIEEGEIRDANGTDNKLFVKEFPALDNPIGVVVDTSDGKIITVEWRYND